METITITKKEYNALVFAKGVQAKKSPPFNKGFLKAAFGVFKRSFGKNSSIAHINKIRKSWR